MLNLFVFSEHDRRIWDWLSTIREPQKVRIAIDQPSGCISAVCDDLYTAKDLWRSRHKLDTGDDCETLLFVHVKDRVYASGSVRSQGNSKSATEMDTLSIWAKQNAGLFKAMPGFVFLHSADANSGFKFLAVKPDINEERLNRPIVNLLGQPLRVTDERIALPKERAIQKAIAMGETQSYGYGFNWNGKLWHFQVSVVPLLDIGEVLVIVKDVDQQAHWQRGYWLNTAT